MEFTRLRVKNNFYIMIKLTQAYIILSSYNVIVLTIQISSLQKRRLEPQGWTKMFQRDKASHEKETLGNRFRQADNECGKQCGGKNESPSYIPQRNTNF